MSLLRLTNNSGGQMVCDLFGERKTLRLNHKESDVIQETEVTTHITNIIAKGLLLSEVITEVEPTVVENIKKSTSKKSGSKEKEE